MFKVIGLIALQDSAAFDEYRGQVAATVELHGGRVSARGTRRATFWNELRTDDFQGYVELEFPDEAQALRWASSPEYAALLPVRSRAMKLTLFLVAT